MRKFNIHTRSGHDQHERMSLTNRNWHTDLSGNAVHFLARGGLFFERGLVHGNQVKGRAVRRSFA